MADTGSVRGPAGWRVAAVVLSLALALSLAGPGQTVALAQETEPCPVAEVGPAPLTDRGDVPAVHRYAVDCAFWHEIVQGFPDNRYGPSVQVRRDQMASFVARALAAAGVALPPPDDERFTDVDPDSPHDENIHRLAAADIVHGGPSGLPADSYGPALRVRRDQMASFLLRAAEFATNQDLANQEQRFPDVPPTNTHFGNVNGAHEIGLVRGFGDGTYRPHVGVRRDQMAAFVIRLLEALTGADPTTVWYPVDLSGSIPPGERYPSPGDALDALVAAMDLPQGAAVSHRITAWSETHGVVEVREMPDDSLSGEDILVRFLQDAQGWYADPAADARAHCRRGVSDTDPALCL